MRDWIRYARTRMGIAQVAVVSLVVGAAWLVGPPPSVTHAIGDVVLVLLFVLQFRLWDDLSDLQRDRLEHPQRVLSQTTQTRSFWCGVGLLGALGGGVVWWRGPLAAIVAVGVLHVALWLWYAFPGRRSLAIADYHVVLLKYPVFAFLIATRVGVGVDTFFMAACVYWVVCIYEVVHDRKLRAHVASRVVAAAEATLFCVLVVVLFSTHLYGFNR